MIDLHTHTLFSDGELLPSELVYYAKVKGYTAICLSDHIDFTNMDFVIPRIVQVAKDLTEHYKILVIPGAELTCNPPVEISKAVTQARKFGAKIILVHGGTSLETTPPGTNLSAILSGADILAHPGMISEEDVKLSVENNVALEITTRKLYTSANFHVASLAKKYNAKLVFNSDTHLHNELLTEDTISDVLKAAKLTKEDFNQMQQNAVEIISGKKSREKDL